MEPTNETTKEVFDLDLDLNIQSPDYGGPLYSLHQAALQYTYDDERISAPEKIYTVSGDAITPVIRRMHDADLIQLSIQADILRYVVQQELGRRGAAICQQADTAASRYFQVGKLGDMTFDSSYKKVEVSQSFLDDLGDLEL